MKKLRMIVNISMTVVLLFLMSYSLIGEMTHEILGTLMFVLFTVHHILNRKWFSNIAKGKYTMFRSLQTLLVFMMIISVLASAISGILLSNKLYTFLPRVSGTAFLRDIHLVCAYLNYILMSVHLGLHWNSMMSAMMKNNVEKTELKAMMLRVLAIAIAGYGVYAFIKHRIGEYLLLKTHFVFLDTSRPLIFFFIDYIAIMGLFVFIGHYLAKFTKKIDKSK